MSTIIDFVFLQNLIFQFIAILGLILIIFGGLIRMKARIELKKRAGFSSFFGTAKLQIVEDQKLLTDGIYKHIRHPLYLGEILRNLGIAVFFTSIYGFLIILLSFFFLLVRIEIEEKMLLLAFGKNYLLYKKKTRKIFPYLY
ncbi:MAG: isoprenylcysteine carboxylmethyltransferase family protein [Candidatus Bathyarchaeota archaeon]|nr:isoprenylcysteine carboxylmethyltransferase family protein [Candidatus Bathyarchaeota archaeon]